MASPSQASLRQIVYNILQFLESVNLKETARMLESESGFYFNVRHFEELFLGGAFEEAEKYISAFTSIHDNMFSARIVFEIRKQKFLEALDNGDRSTALTIITEEFKVFEQYNGTLVNGATKLLMSDNIRQHTSLRYYGDTAAGRSALMEEIIKKCLTLNPVLHGKLVQFASPMSVNNNYNHNNSNHSLELRPLMHFGLGLANVGAGNKDNGVICRHRHPRFTSGLI